MADRDSVIKIVQKCWALAEHPNTPPHERDLAIQRARELMAKYAIEEITMQEKSGKREEIVMANIRITEDGKPAMVKDQRIALAWTIASKNRCRGVIRTLDETADVATGRKVPGGTFITVVGYKSDTDFVREFYFGLCMDMLGAVLDEKVTTNNYRESFCAGYVTRVDERLTQISRTIEREAEKAEGGSLLPALVDRSKKVEDTFDEMFPNLTKVRVTRKKYDQNAIMRGRKAADGADLGGRNKVEGGAKTGIAAPRKELS